MKNERKKKMIQSCAEQLRTMYKALGVDWRDTAVFKRT